ncbi:MAG: B12-binding domain-containing radical SAM protein [Candidatus Aminicenantes bacterium]|nr:B12-binding domain-containing radical SAM protein [Candidatus Aminicenantes bacterium]
MRIALADLPKKEGYYHAAFPNLGLLYLAGALRARFGGACPILWLDPLRNLKEHLDSLDAFRPDIYGLSFAYFTRELAANVIGRVRSRFPALPIVCGGPMPTASPRQILEETAADVCVRGEGEEALCDLVDSFGGRGRGLKDIPGIAYTTPDGKVVETAHRTPVSDLDRIPLPAWDLVDFRKYGGWYMHRASPQAHVLANRGCPYDCVYCSNPVWKYGKPWLRLRSPAGIAEEVRLLYGLGVREVYLSADELNVNERWAREVCEAIAALGRRDLFLNANIRPDVMTPELAQAFRRAGLWIAHLGIESGNQKTLDGVGKKVTLEQIVDCCRILKGAGIKVFGFVMLFHAWEEAGHLRWESPEDVDRTLVFCRRLLKDKLMDYLSWQTATPMPGSRLWDIAVRHGLLPHRAIRGIFERNLRLPGVTDKDVQRALRRGLWLKGLAALRNGGFPIRHVHAVLANAKVMLGLGPPRGAY